MIFHSTGSQACQARLSDAILQGLAADGGLFVPATLPQMDIQGVPGLAELGRHMLAPFFQGDPLEARLSALCADAFSFPAPMVHPEPQGPYILELFHGPTGAFKDYGARFLMAALDQLSKPDRPVTVLVATSGDTGGAVGQAAEGRKGLRAFILYPKGRVSTFQEQQLTCWKEPVGALRLPGDFDAAQALVKRAFAEPDMKHRYGLTSANSINVARLLPQMVYWAQAALSIYAKNGERPGLIVPTGNLGNAVAALYARAMGLPMGPVILAINANATLHDWAISGEYRPRASIATMANAMDVGAPSNFARMQALDAIHKEVRVQQVSDGAIRSRIHQTYDACGYSACPHTACALETYARLPRSEQSTRPWIIAATAHAYKFADGVEPIIGTRIAPPPALAAVLQRPTHVRDLPAADLAALEQALSGG